MKELTPFSVTHKTPIRVDPVDLSDAVEVKPVILFGFLPAGSTLSQGLDLSVNPSPVVKEAKAASVESKEVEGAAGSDDPKADSSAIDSASPSSSGTSESGSPIIQMETPIHPSSLQDGQESPVPVVKEQTLPPLPFSPTKNG